MSSSTSWQMSAWLEGIHLDTEELFITYGYFTDLSDWYMIIDMLTEGSTASGKLHQCTDSGCPLGKAFFRFWYIVSQKNGVKGAINCISEICLLQWRLFTIKSKNFLMCSDNSTWQSLAFVQSSFVTWQALKGNLKVKTSEANNITGCQDPGAPTTELRIVDHIMTLLVGGGSKKWLWFSLKRFPLSIRSTSHSRHQSQAPLLYGLYIFFKYSILINQEPWEAEHHILMEGTKSANQHCEWSFFIARDCVQSAWYVHTTIISF